MSLPTRLLPRTHPSSHFTWIRLVVICCIIALVAILTNYLLNLHSKNPTASLVSFWRPTPTPAAKLPATPPEWPTYTSPYGFSFHYPTDWGIDDSYLTPYKNLHAAFLDHANHVTIYSSQAAEEDATKGPSLTITTASLADEEVLLHKSLETSQDWLEASISGLPSGSNTSTVQIGSNVGIELSGLKVLKGSYQVIYLIDSKSGTATRFDLDYPLGSSSTTLEQIIGSFSTP